MGNNGLGPSHGLSVVVCVVVVSERVTLLELEVVLVVLLIEVMLVVVIVPLTVLVVVSVTDDEVVVVSVSVIVTEVVVASHSTQPEQRAHVQITAHPRVCSAQVSKQLCGASVDAPVVVVGGLMSRVPVGAGSVTVELVVVEDSSGGLYSPSLGGFVGTSSTLGFSKLKLYTTGFFVVGRTTLAQASHVEHTHQPHLQTRGAS